MQKCSTCHLIKNLEEFHSNRSRPNGKHSTCKECTKRHNRGWRTSNPEKKKAQNRGTNSSSRFKKYGITEDDYMSMLNEQLGMCAICKVKQATHIDHSHKTGEVRGLLCFQCNSAIGLLYDNIDFLQSAIEYLI